MEWHLTIDLDTYIRWYLSITHWLIAPTWCVSLSVHEIQDKIDWYMCVCVRARVCNVIIEDEC
jgi:hypothetical protein